MVDAMDNNARVREQKLVSVDVGDLRVHPMNPRRGDVDAIEESIVVNGFYGAIVVQKSTNYVLAGNHRLLAAQKVGLDKLPAFIVDVDEEQAQRILLADNRTSDLGVYDDEALASLLDGLAQSDAGLVGTGYEDSDLEDLLIALRPPVDLGEGEGSCPSVSEELQAKWGTEPGQLWKAGGHRILCGDSTNPNDVARLLDGATPNLMVTDPPYGVEYDASWRKSRGPIAREELVRNDDRAGWSCAWALFEGSVAYVWHASCQTIVGNDLEHSGFDLRAQIIWRKPVPIISRGHYNWQHEACWYAVRSGATASWIGDAKQHTIWDIPLKDDADMQSHSTQKPTACMQIPIHNHEGDVYDPFCGSGTTAIAAEREGRKSYCMEIDPKFVAVILERLALEGLEPILQDG